jgi:outer membrane protein, heavy metal efflux system
VWCLCALLWCAPQAALGQALELDEVLGGLEQRHPTMEGARSGVRAAQGARRAADGAFDTSLEGLGEVTPQGPGGQNARLEAGVRQPTTWWGAQVIVGWRLGLGDFPVYKGAYKTVQPQGEVFAGVDVPLLRDGRVDKRRLAMGKAELATRVAEQKVREERLKLTLKAAQTYWKWVASGQKLRVEQRLLQMAQDRDAALRARVDAGDLPEIDHIENQRAIAQRRARVVVAQGALREQAILLSLYWRDGEGQPQVPDEAMLPAEVAWSGQGEEGDGVAGALERRPELAAIGLKRRGLELERGWAQNQRLPKLDVGAKASKGLVAGIDYLDEVSVGVKVQYYLGQEVARGQEEAAEAELVRLGAEERLLRDEITAQVRAAAVSLDVSRQEVTLVERELEIARRVEEAERERLALGDSTLLLVNLREQASADAEKRLIDARAAYQGAYAAYQAAAGQGAAGGGARR